MPVNEEVTHHRPQIDAEPPLLRTIGSSAQDIHKPHEYLLHHVVGIGLVDVPACADERPDHRRVQLHEQRPLGGIVAIRVFGDLAKQGLGRIGNHRG